jgi:hypothetical protein
MKISCMCTFKSTYSPFRIIFPIKVVASSEQVVKNFSPESKMTPRVDFSEESSLHPKLFLSVPIRTMQEKLLNENLKKVATQFS